MNTKIKILSIETSCDETGVSVVEYDTVTQTYEVLADTLNSQIEMHKEFGGVFPTVAKREHGNNLLGLLNVCLKKIETGDELDIEEKNIHMELLNREKELTEHVQNFPIQKIPNIDYIAVTRGPGLEPALWVGVSFAKFLSVLWQKPLVPVNHMEGHISSVLMGAGTLSFPNLALLISGGHTELVDIHAWGKYHIVGKTRDDAVGEAYDKVARILGLSYPGGPLIAAKAQKVRDTMAEWDIQANKEKHNIKLPRPMLHSKDMDLSFSGLKTAVLYMVRDLGTVSEEVIDLICHEFENSVAEVLVSKLEFANKAGDRAYKNLIVAGGVISNDFLKARIDAWCQKNEIRFLKPEKSLATDNAVMIALAAIVGITNNYAKIILPESEEFSELKPDGDWSVNTI